MYEWGDSRWDFGSLWKGAREIETWTKRLALFRPWSREKYGTIRYDLFFGLSKYRLIARLQIFIFTCIVFRVCKRYPHVARGFLNDLKYKFMYDPLFFKRRMKRYYPDIDEKQSDDDVDDDF